MEMIYLRLRALSPVRVTDQAISSENWQLSRSYIPGSAVRGMAAGKMAADEAALETLLTKVRFLNLLPVSPDGHFSLPTPKGYYAQKDGSDFTSVLKNLLPTERTKELGLADGDIPPGAKRAKLGPFAVLENRKIRHFSVQTEEKMRVNLQGKLDPEDGAPHLFSQSAISAGQIFEGYIDCTDAPELTEQLLDCFQQDIYLGAGRRSGFGRMQVENVKRIDAPKYTVYSSYQEPVSDFYLLLLSPTAMRCSDPASEQYGELCGLDLGELGRRLGTDVTITLCSTSVVSIAGRNSTWRSAVQTMPMYDAGCVFRMHTAQPVSPEKLHALEQSGLGVRRQEGYGQVLVLSDYESIYMEEKIVPIQQTNFKTIDELWSGMTADEQKMQKIIARRIYLQRLDKQKTVWLNEMSGNAFSQKVKGKLSDSQLGTLQSVINNAVYSQNPKGDMDDFFVYRLDNKKDDVRKKYKTVLTYIDSLFAGSPEEWMGMDEAQSVCGLPVSALMTAAEQDKWKLRAFSELIDHSRKKRGGNQK